MDDARFRTLGARDVNSGCLPRLARCYAQEMPRYEISSGRRSPATRVTLLILLLCLLFGVRSFSGYAIEIEWWKELGQFHTWLSMLYYSIARSEEHTSELQSLRHL